MSGEEYEAVSGEEYETVEQRPEEPKTILQEVYASLLYNDMVQDNLSVVVYEAEKFFCLGTPDDYEQYMFWWKYFHEKQKLVTKQVPRVKRIGLIPMAGMGSRFREYG